MVSRILKGLLRPHRAALEAPVERHLDVLDIAVRRTRGHVFSDVLEALLIEHSQEFDALASRLGVPADVDFGRMAFEAARMASVHVDFTTIEACIRFLKAASRGQPFAGAVAEAQHDIDWVEVQPSGPTYRAALRGLCGWFSWYEGTAPYMVFGDFSDSNRKTRSALRPFMESSAYARAPSLRPQGHQSLFVMDGKPTLWMETSAGGSHSSTRGLTNAVGCKGVSEIMSGLKTKIVQEPEDDAGARQSWT